jgi:hypothetical protein
VSSDRIVSLLQLFSAAGCLGSHALNRLIPLPLPLRPMAAGGDFHLLCAMTIVVSLVII